MWKINQKLVNSKDLFIAYSPGLSSILKIKYIKLAFILKPVLYNMINIIKGDDISQVTGNILGNIILDKLGRNTINTYVNKGLKISSIRRRGLIPGLKGLSATYRTLVSSFDSNNKARIIKPVRIMYHDAQKAGKHLDIHIGYQSIVVRVSGKPVEKELKFKNNILTESSKEALINHLKKEISNNSRVVHNHDHTVSNALCSWFSPILEGYGSGNTRQLVLEDKAELYHKSLSTQHWYIPSLFSNTGTYIYEIYKGTAKKAPILIWGKLKSKNISFEDRLHLKMIQPEELNKYKSIIDKSTNTKKYDGASAYFITNEKGIKLFSPRISKKTGNRIEYTFKVPELAETRTSINSKGMGELLFWKKTWFGNIWNILFSNRGFEFICWNYLPPAGTAGVLNSNKIRNSNIYPELRIYRIDELNKNNRYDDNFHENRKHQLYLVKNLKNNFIKIVKKSYVTRNILTKKWEGFVGVPKNKSINNGIKLKWHGDLFDWRIDNVSFYLSEKQNIAGIIQCTSLESGKKFNLGPGQVGTVERCISMIENPEKWKGKVLKVSGFNGYEGRAAKVREIHLDKGKE